MTLRAHHRNDLAGQFVPAKEIGLKNSAQPVGGQVFDRAGQAMRAVVEQRVQCAAGGLKHFGQTCGDAVAVGIVDPGAVKALRPQSVAIALLTARRKHPPTPRPHSVRRVQTDAGRTAGDEN